MKYQVLFMNAVKIGSLRAKSHKNNIVSPSFSGFEINSSK